MKTKLYFLITLFAFFTLTVLPIGFAQSALPQPSVQLVYFLSNDRKPHQNIDAKIDRLIKDIQNFYANEMERNGFGRKTFRFETDANGKARVHHINGKFSAAYYNTEDGAFDKILAEIGEQFETSGKIYFIVADVTFPGSYWRGGGEAYLDGPSILYIDVRKQGFITKYHAGHELAHSFGLRHDFRSRSNISEADITSYQVGIDFNNRRLSKCAAEWLDVHPYFNPNHIPFNEPLTVQMLPPLAYPPNAISLRFNVTDPDGLHQAQLVIPREGGFSLHGCKSLKGRRSNTVEFITTELTATANNEVELKIIDVHGNFRSESFHIQTDDIVPVDRIINIESVAPQVLQKPPRDDVSGDNQRGFLNSRLLKPFVVTVRDADDEPVAGVQVKFQVITEAGDLSVTNPWTDSEGQAQTFLTLGSLQGEYRVAASVTGVSDPVIFTALVNKETVATSTPLKTLTGHTDIVFSVAYSPDGSLIATGSWAGPIRLWDGATGQKKKILGEHVDLRGVYSLAFSPDGLTLASGNTDGTIRLWDVKTGNHKLKIDGRSYITPVVAYSPDGSKIVSGTLTGEIHVWDAVTGEYKTSFTGHPGSNVVSLSFNRKGALLASGGTDRIIRLWDVATGQQLETITEHSIDDRYGDWVEVVFSHNGGKLASTGAWDLTARLWDATGQHLKTFRHTSGVYAVAFSPDDRTLATGSFDGDIRLWDTVTGLAKKILIGHTESVTSLAFSPNGDMLVSGSSDHTVRLWEIPLTGDVNGDGSVVSKKTEVNTQTKTVRIRVDANDRPPMYWIDTAAGTLHRLVGVEVENLMPSVQNATGLTVDVANNKLYWTEKTNNRAGKIRRANLDGTNIRLVKNLASVPLDIALDTVDDKLYLASSLGKVQRLNVNGSGFQPNFIRGLNKRMNIAVDTAGQQLYLTSSAGKISRRNLRGGGSEEVVTGLGNPGGLVLGVPPTAAQAAVPPATTDQAEDVNQDGKVDNVDLGMVAAALFGGNPPATLGRLDVNGDGELTIDDLTQVSNNLDEEDAAAAPVLGILRNALVRDKIQGAIDLLLATDDGSLGVRRTLAYLQNLLTTARPDETQLFANYPNPFNPETWIPYQLSTGSDVCITIYDASGKVVRRLVLGYQSTGYYTSRSRAVYWDGRNDVGESVASGIYFYIFTAGDFTATRKLLIRK